MDWQIGDFAICITPGSKLENRLVMVISHPLVDPSKEDVVYWVHPGLPDGNNWGWGAEKRHLSPVPNWIEPIEWEEGAETVGVLSNHWDPFFVNIAGRYGLDEDTLRAEFADK